MDASSYKRPSSSRRLSRTSLLRLLPVLLIGLLPFNPVDDALLGSLYALRGKKEAPSQIRAISYRSQAELSKMLTLSAEAGIKKCVVLSPDTNSNVSPCLWMPLEDLYTQDLTVEDFTKLREYLAGESSSFGPSYRPLLYGKLDKFSPEPATKFLGSNLSTLKATQQMPIFFPQLNQTKIHLPSAIGSLSATELGLNVIGNAAEGSYLKRSSRFIQWPASAATALIVGWILYSYPVFLALLFVIGIATTQFVFATMALDRLGLQGPLASCLVTVIVMYLLAMTDRLDRRERREWRLEQESHNLKQLDEMRNNFLSLVSHDLKTPVAKMQSTLERFLRQDFGTLTKEQNEQLQKILAANGHLQRSISTLLLLSRVETREIRINFEPTDLTQLLENVAQSLSPYAAERHIQFSLELEPMFLVNLDQALIKEVVSNLIDNAMKYSPQGGKITIRCGELDNCPELLPPQPGVWFEVQDQGPGVSPADRKKVFQKFVRGSAENAPADQSIVGTGLGLFLTKYFVEQHNGIVSLYSRTAGEKIHPGDANAPYFPDTHSSTGTVLRVTLPIDQPET